MCGTNCRYALPDEAKETASKFRRLMNQSQTHKPREDDELPAPPIFFVALRFSSNSLKYDEIFSQNASLGSVWGSLPQTLLVSV